MRHSISDIINLSTKKLKMVKSKKHTLDIKTYNAMDEHHIFGNFMPTNEVLLGAYNTDEWLAATIRRKAINDGINLLCDESKWITPQKFKLAEFIAQFNCNFSFSDKNNVTIFSLNDSRFDNDSQTGVFTINHSRNKLNVSLLGSSKWCEIWNQLLAEHFTKAESLIEWVYGPHGEEISIPLNFRPAIKAAYPWLDRPLDEFISQYIESDASVLILIGPPGTGKCLDPNEEIELLVSDEIFEKLSM